MSVQGFPKKKLNSSQNIKVVVRVRPLSNDEKEKRIRTVVHCNSLREIQTKEKKYYFDRVFDPESSQMDVYSFVVAPMIGDVLSGYNCTVFAYGQTGTGKTHTMTGGDSGLSSSLHWRDDELAGCIPRAAANIFDEIGSSRVIDYNVRVSFLELYNEEVRDLLSQDERPPPLNIFNDNKGSVCIQNLNEISVFNSNDIYMLLQQGTLKRQTAATLMNNHSSRSHSVFTITVHTREEVLKTGKINLVDLAGSENIAKSGAKDKRAQELANINRSLLTLGRVIQILAEKNNKHVPYRDSKLTRILQDSLGGHTKTCIIATISPSHTSYEETMSTLEYACRARDIRNTPMVNEKVTKAQMMKVMTHEIEKLKKDLEASRNGEGFFLDQSNWEELNSQLQTNSSALSLKNEIIEDMKKKLTDLQTVRDIKEKEFEEVMNVCKHEEKILAKAKALLKEQYISLKREQFICRHYWQAATESSIKAKELFEATKFLSRNQDILQRKLENQYFNNYTNEKIIHEKGAVLSDNLVLAMAKLDNLQNKSASNTNIQKKRLSDTRTLTEEYTTSLLAFENESRHLIGSQFKEHVSLIRDNTLNTVEGIERHQEEINEMLGITKDTRDSCTAAIVEFKKYNEITSSKYISMHNFLVSTRSYLKDARKRQDDILNFMLEERQKLDDIINSIDTSDIWNNTSLVERESQRAIESNFKDIQLGHDALTNAFENTSSNLELQKRNCRQNEEILIENCQGISTRVDEVTNETITKVEDFARSHASHLDSVAGNVCEFEETLEGIISELKAILDNTNETGKNIKKDIIPVQKAGDTPKQNCFNYAKPVSEGALSRDVLVKRFMEEFNEDIENQSFHLNVSSASIEPLNVSDSDIQDSEEFLERNG